MTHYIELRFGHTSWRVRADVAGTLFDGAGLRLDSWLRSGQATVVKDGPHRTVYRVELGGRCVYVKHYRVADARAMISQWAQGSRGRREWCRVEQAAACGVPTIVPLALGEQRRGGLVLENYLVSEGIADAEPLDGFVERVLPRLGRDRQAAVRRRLADGLAELIARLHEGGIVHADLHAGNVLVRLRPADRVELYLIDLHAARPPGRLGWRRSRKNLIQFGIYFLEAGQALDRARFLRRYLELRPRLGVGWKAAAAGLDRDLVSAAQRFWRRRDARCTANNRRFFYRDIGPAHGFSVTELGEPALLALLRDPDAPLGMPAAQVLKDSGSSTVARLTMALGGVPSPVVYKRFNCVKWLDPVRATLHHSPALRAWHAGHGLLLRGIPTPRPLAVIERTRGPLVHESYLITALVPDALSLDDYVKRVVAGLAARPRRRRVCWLAGELGRLARKMHERSISHRDMKAVNFLVTPGRADADSPQLHLIDLAGVQIWRHLPAFRRLQNLTRILVSLRGYPAVTRTVFLRFLRAYLPRGLRDGAAWKATWRELGQRASRKIARNHRLSRPIT